MTQLPILLPGMVPLLPMPAPAEQAAPTEAPASDPFLAILTALVGAPAARPEKPETTSVAPVDAEAEPEDGDTPDPEPPVLPVLPQLPVAVAVTPPPPQPPASPAAPKAPEAKIEAKVEAKVVAPVLESPAPAAVPAPPGTQQPTAPPAATAPTGPTPLAAPTATAPVVPTRPPGPAPVAHQVFRQVVRVAVSGETPKRVVVRLEPEHLGEVRVVLRTGRAGLEVSLAAGAEARAAIREGAPELRRMLEAVGSPDARILVRHLSDAPASAPVSAPAPVAGPPTTSASVRTDAATPVPGPGVDVGAGTTGGTAHGDRRDRPQQDAHPVAMDGLPDHPLESARQARRASGLDVMM